MQNTALFTPARSREEAVMWVKVATKTIGLGFHPDTPACDYLNGQTGKPLFKASDAQSFDAALEAAFGFLGEEIYEEGLTMIQTLLRGSSAMDKKTAEQLEVLVGGEAWQSGGDIWLVTVHRKDGSLVVFSGDAVAEYENEEAFEEGNAKNVIDLTIPEDGDLYVLVDTKGNVLYKNAELQRGWLHEEDARQEAMALQSRGEGKFQVIRKSEA